jgi:3'-phosphoadenosine 5'-phosphosulfate (PAPS) 3'-phosphatase
MSAYLNRTIELYLNDLSDYDNANLLLAESALKPMRQLITEGKKNQNQIIIETLKKATPEHKLIIEDFLLYVREGEF